MRLDPAEYPLDGRWFHVGVLVRGNSPRGVQVTVDGVPRGDIDGFTHLTASLGSVSPGDPGGTISVESTRGFPDKGVLRIGDEIIEYVSKTETSFICDRDLVDAFGGRAVREATDSFAVALDSSHPEGSGVELYGYSAILDGDISPGGARLSGSVGPWSMAGSISGPEDIVGEIQQFPGIPIEMGVGIGASYLGEIELAPLEQAPTDELYLEAFQTDGGYALMWQGRLAVVNAEDGSRFGGMEIVRYSSADGAGKITLSERNILTEGISEAPDGFFSPEGNTYVMEFLDNILVNVDGGTPANDLETLNVYIMPISVQVQGATDLSYRGGDPELSEFVQLTNLQDPGMTEWVRYDTILNGNFLRDDWGALNRAIGALFDDSLADEDVGPAGGPPPRGIAVAGAPASSPSGFLLLDRPAVPPPPAPAPEQDPDDDKLLRAKLGAPEERDAFIQDILERYHFRGVLGTYDHAHAPGIEAVPVFSVRRWRDVVPESEPSFGFVGRHDRVAVLQAGSQQTPFWYTVMWSQAPSIELGRVRTADTYVAFTTSPGIPYLGSDFAQLLAQGLNQDLRNFNRITKFPNGERPLALAEFTVGGDSTGSRPEFQGLVDEVALHAVAGMGNPAQSASRGAFILQQDLEQGETDFIDVDPIYVVVDGMEQNNGSGTAGNFLQNLPTSGLLDIDGERIAYVDVDPGAGRITIAPEGRGLHGTEQRGHSTGARVFVVDDRPATALTSGMSVTSADVLLEDRTGIGLYDALLIGEEIVHAPYRGAGTSYMGMPRARRFGASGEEGPGLLRGRFGTDPAPHAEGELVYALPTRWADSYAPRSDDGAHARFEAAYEGPNAYWKGVTWQAEVPDQSNEIRVLARVAGADWEGDPR
ncbi:MAG: hypothetical protein ACYTF3_12530, partial [Planctomycetota bacterium]